MALVLQNDSRGLKANGYKGQALNVYGNDQANYSSSSQIASTGIQNSWALKFDTFLNQDDGRDNAGIASSFDLGNKSNGDNKIIKNGHMASTYPGESSSYVRYSSESSILGDKYWYGLNHYGLINGVINSDANWHHVTLSWNKDTQKMTYTINDKKLDGTPLYQAEPGYAYQTKTIDLDVKKLGSAATSTCHIRYGFTGSTGGYYANNVVIFDQVPDLVNSRVNATIYDETQNKYLKNDDEVSVGDKLTYSYTLNYDSGKQSWQNINEVTQLANNKSVNFLDYDTYPANELGYINYSNGDSETIAMDKDMDGNNLVKHSFKNELSNSINQAVNVFKGVTVSADNQDKYVKSELARFIGNNNIGDVNTPSFYIRTQKEMAMTVDPSEQTTSSTEGSKIIIYNADAIIAPHVKFTNNDATDYFNQDNLKIYVSINGSDYEECKYSVQSDKETYNLKLNNSDLNYGKNDVSVYATYTGNSKSNEIHYVLDKKRLGDLKFGTVSDKSSFSNTTLDAKDQLVGRNNDWSLNVIDTREPSGFWKVSAESGSFVDQTTGRKMIGDVIYKNNSLKSSIVNNPVIVADNNLPNLGEDIDIVNSLWNNSDGIFVRTYPGALPGNFIGTISWTLEDTP